MAMTDDERYHFDVAGFFVRPAVLNADEIAAIRDHVDRLLHHPDQVEPDRRATIAGPASLLIDHPRVVDVLHEVIGPDVRLENSFAIWREQGSRHHQGFHRGGENSADPIFGYRVGDGRIFAGVVRVVFELTEVGPDDGATCFLAGSHKAAFPAPEGHLWLDGVEDKRKSPLAMSYACPAGSVVFFTENLLHAGPVWRGAEPRVAVLNAYNNLLVNFHRLSVPDEVLGALSREHQAWFRQPWLMDFRTKPPTRNTVERFLTSADETMPGV